MAKEKWFDENPQIHDDHGRVKDENVAREMADTEDPFHKKRLGGLMSASKDKIAEGETKATERGAELIEQKREQARLANKAEEILSKAAGENIFLKESTSYMGASVGMGVSGQQPGFKEDPTSYVEITRPEKTYKLTTGGGIPSNFAISINMMNKGHEIGIKSPETGEGFSYYPVDQFDKVLSDLAEKVKQFKWEWDEDDI